MIHDHARRDARRWRPEYRHVVHLALPASSMPLPLTSPVEHAILEHKREAAQAFLANIRRSRAARAKAKAPERRRLSSLLLRQAWID